MKFGLTEQQYLELLEHLVKPLAAKGAKVWCFGSRARGNHRPFSDLDIMIEPGADDLGLLLSEIREYFENSNFPFKLDIVQLKDFAESYRAGAEKDRIRII